MRLAILSLLMTGLILACGTTTVSATEPVWMTVPNDAWERTVKQEKPLVVFVSTSWCGYCKKMQKEVWSTKEIQSRVDKDFIPLYLDAEKFPKAAQALGVESYPTTVIITPDGKTQASEVGYLATAKLQKLLDKGQPQVIQTKGWNLFPVKK